LLVYRRNSVNTIGKTIKKQVGFSTFSVFHRSPVINAVVESGYSCCSWPLTQDFDIMEEMARGWVSIWGFFFLYISRINSVLQCFELFPSMEKESTLGGFNIILVLGFIGTNRRMIDIAK